jgi:hypothetical protein
MARLADDKALASRLGAAGRAFAERSLAREPILAELEAALLDHVRPLRRP